MKAVTCCRSRAHCFVSVAVAAECTLCVYCGQQGLEQWQPMHIIAQQRPAPHTLHPCTDLNWCFQEHTCLETVHFAAVPVEQQQWGLGYCLPPPCAACMEWGGSVRDPGCCLRSWCAFARVARVGGRTRPTFIIVHLCEVCVHSEGLVRQALQRAAARVLGHFLHHLRPSLQQHLQ